MSEINTPASTSQPTSHCAAPHCVGIDVSKAWLDVAVAGANAVSRFANAAEGHVALIEAFRRQGIRRVGLEATGGYEQDTVQALRDASFEVHVFQPKQVKAYAIYRRQAAKTDRIDARLIALCTAGLDAVRPAPDVRLQGFSALLTLIEQMGEDITRAKTRAEHVKAPEIRTYHAGEIKRLRAAQRQAYARLASAVRADAAFKARLELIESIDGIGVRTALAMLIRMPELGTISREQAAHLIGLAPITRQSGTSKSESHIEGGRARARTALFACTQAAIKWNDQLKAFYARLISKGKHHRKAIVACARKLTTFINTVLQRKTNWQRKPITNT
jgi:transposase